MINKASIIISCIVEQQVHACNNYIFKKDLIYKFLEIRLKSLYGDSSRTEFCSLSEILEKSVQDTLF